MTLLLKRKPHINIHNTVTANPNLEISLRDIPLLIFNLFYKLVFNPQNLTEVSNGPYSYFQLTRPFFGFSYIKKNYIYNEIRNLIEKILTFNLKEAKKENVTFPLFVILILALPSILKKMVIYQLQNSLTFRVLLKIEKLIVDIISSSLFSTLKTRNGSSYFLFLLSLTFLTYLSTKGLKFRYLATILYFIFFESDRVIFYNEITNPSSEIDSTYSPFWLYKVSPYIDREELSDLKKKLDSLEDKQQLVVGKSIEKSEREVLQSRYKTLKLSILASNIKRHKENSETNLFYSYVTSGAYYSYSWFINKISLILGGSRVFSAVTRRDSLVTRFNSLVIISSYYLFYFVIAEQSIAILDPFLLFLGSFPLYFFTVCYPLDENQYLPTFNYSTETIYDTIKGFMVTETSRITAWFFVIVTYYIIDSKTEKIKNNEILFLIVKVILLFQRLRSFNSEAFIKGYRFFETLLFIIYPNYVGYYPLTYIDRDYQKPSSDDSYHDPVLTKIIIEPFRTSFTTGIKNLTTSFLNIEYITLSLNEIQIISSTIVLMIVFNLINILQRKLLESNKLLFLQNSILSNIRKIDTFLKTSKILPFWLSNTKD
jgi:hypothetical protein